MLKKLLLVAAVLFPMLASAQTLKIGIVDTQELIAKMPDTAAAQKQLEDVGKKYQDEYAKLGEEYKRLVDEFQNMKEDELPAIRERKTREISDYQQKIQTFEQNADQDLQKMQYDLMSPILVKIRTAIEAVGKEGSYSLVQNKDAQIILYYDSPVVDITNDVKAKLGIN